MIWKALLGSNIEGFSIDKLLGSGSYGAVFCATEVSSGNKYAMKIPVYATMREEKEIMNQLNHPSIVKMLKEVHDKNGRDCVVMEYHSGGDLLHYLQKRTTPLTETQAKHYFLQILSAVEHMHNHNVYHRDIKLENILLSEDERNASVSDFGCAIRCSADTPLQGSIGTIGYAAPEVCKGSSYLAPAADIWSLGCVLYAMLFSKLPFVGDDDSLAQRIQDGAFDLPTVVSVNCVDFLQQLLKYDPNTRATIEAIKKHPWINPSPSSSPTRSTSSRRRLSPKRNGNRKDIPRTRSGNLVSIPEEEFSLESA